MHRSRTAVVTLDASISRKMPRPRFRCDRAKGSTGAAFLRRGLPVRRRVTSPVTIRGRAARRLGADGAGSDKGSPFGGWIGRGPVGSFIGPDYAAAALEPREGRAFGPAAGRTAT